MKQTEKTELREDSHTAMRVARVTMFINLGLSVLKLAAGLIARSGAMVSDAVHSASDVLSTVIVMIGMRAAGKRLTGSIHTAMNGLNVWRQLSWRACCWRPD